MTSATFSKCLSFLALEPVLFADRFGTTREEALRSWKEVYNGLVAGRDAAAAEPSDRCVTSKRDKARGRIGLLLLMSLLIERSETQARTGRLVEDFACENRLVTDEAVKDQLVALYRPGHDDSRLASTNWNELRWETLSFFRLGTTSVICKIQSTGRQNESLVLKLLLYPYAIQESIAHATREYATQFPENSGEPLGRVIASSSSWILMLFVKGKTLAEVLNEQSSGDPGPRRNLLRDYGPALVASLALLQKRELEPNRHLDLTPSNVIFRVIPGGAGQQAVLIDLGRNYLYEYRIGRSESRESLYVAPEVRAGSSSDTSDVFSLGLLLASLAVGRNLAEPGIPEVLYQEAPELAAFLDDMIDDNPGRRRVHVEQEDKADFDDIASELDLQLELLDRIAETWPRRTLKSEIVAIGWPSQGQVSLRKVVSDVARRSEQGDAAAAKRLLAWSRLAMAAWYLSFAAVYISLTKDIKLNLLPDPVSVVDWLLGRDDDDSIFNQLRAAGYVDGRLDEYWPSRLICFALGATEFKFYQSVLAGITTTTSRLPGWRRTEFFLRAVSVGTLVPILLCCLVQPHLWPWAAFAGGVLITSVNYCLDGYVQQCALSSFPSTERPLGLSTAISPTDSNLVAFSQWWKTQFVYTLVLLALAVGLNLGWLHDEAVYAVAVAFCTIGIQFVVKLHNDSPRIRGALARAVSCGERAVRSGLAVGG